MSELLFLTSAVFAYMLLTQLADMAADWRLRQIIRETAAQLPPDPHADCPHGQHHLVTCATCGQVVDLHNPYEVAHHSPIGHMPETIQ